MIKYIFALALAFVATFSVAQVDTTTQIYFRYNNEITLPYSGGITFSPNPVQRFTISKPPKPKYGGYKVTRAKIAGWSLCAVGGLADGMVEGYHIDGRTSFERKYNVDRYGYFGRESWRNVYKGGDPSNGFKSPLHSWGGAFDFYHHADDLRKIGYLGGGVVIGIGGAKSNTVWWHYVADFAASFVISAASKSIGYYWIRN